MLRLKILSSLTLSLALLGANCDYYFSSLSGDNGNDGSLASPFASLDKLNSLSMSDKSACLKRGDTFRGAISLKGTATNATITAYGEGAKPIVSGAIAISNWSASSLGSGIYEADISALTLGDSEDLPHLFVNGELMTIARYPNVDSPKDKNWLLVDSGSSDYLIDSDLATYGKGDDYWKGATLRIRNYSWTFKACEITGFVASSGKLSASCLSNQLPQWGYFIDGKLEELDYPGEWYYDKTNQKIYLYPKDGIDPNTALVEAMSYEVGVNVYWQEHNVTVENLDVRYYSDSAFNVNSSQNVTIQDCEVHHSNEALSFWNAADLSFSRNLVSDTFKNFVTANAQADFDDGTPTISDNNFSNNALYRAYGVRSDGVYNGEGLRLFGNGMKVTGNRIEDIGWTGIYLKGSGGHIIQNNLVRGALSILNDGGAISIGASSNDNTIVGNILIESVGNVDESNGCASTNSTPCTKHSSYGMGIGSDDGSSGHTIQNNIIANNPDMGIRMNLFNDTLVENNLLFNNDPDIVLQGSETTSQNNIIRSNIIYAKSDELGFYLQGDVTHGSFSANTYCNLYSYLATKRNGINYTLDQWQSSFDNASNNALCSVMQTMQLDAYAYVETGSNLISNSTFDSDTSGWTSSAVSWDGTKLDSGALQIDATQGDLNIGPDKFSLQKDQWYRVSFSMIGNGEGSLQLRMNETTGTWTILEEHHYGITTTRKEYSFVFQSSLDSDESAKLIFTTTSSDPIYWIDNLKVVPIAQPSQNDNQKLVFDPSSASTLDAEVALLINDTPNAQTYTLPSGIYSDIEGATLESVTLAAYSSKIALQKADNRTSYYLSPDGSDSNSCESSDSPCQTLEYVLANKVIEGEGAIIKLLDGTYNLDKTTINRSGASSLSPLTITSNSSDASKVILSSENSITNGFLSIEDSSYVELSHLTIQNISGSEAMGVYIEDATHIVVKNLLINNTTSSGIRASGTITDGVSSTQNITISNNTIIDANNGGDNEMISLSGVDGFEVAYNEVTNETLTQGKEGIDIKQGSRNGSVHHNYIHDTTTVCLYVDGWDQHTYNIEIYKNVIANCGNHGILVASEKNGEVDNLIIHQNVIYNNTTQYMGGIQLHTFDALGTSGVRPLHNIAIINNTLVGNYNGIMVSEDHTDRKNFENIIIANNLLEDQISYALGTKNTEFTTRSGGDIGNEYQNSLYSASDFTISNNAIKLYTTNGWDEYSDFRGTASNTLEINASNTLVTTLPTKSQALATTMDLLQDQGSYTIDELYTLIYNLSDSDNVIDTNQKASFLANFKTHFVTDFNGNSRFRGDAIDIGAQELQMGENTTPTVENNTSDNTTDDTTTNDTNDTTTQEDSNSSENNTTEEATNQEENNTTTTIEENETSTESNSTIGGNTSTPSTDENSDESDSNSDENDESSEESNTSTTPSLEIEGSTTSGSTITILINIDITYNYAWYKNGELMDITGNLYTIQNSDVGSELSIELSYELDGTTQTITKSISVDITTDNSSDYTPATSSIDGHNLIWRDEESGLNVIWKMNQIKRFKQQNLLRVSKLPHWQIKAHSDFNGDGKNDILWRNSGHGGNVIWFMDEDIRVSYYNILSVSDLNWSIATTGYMDDDGKSDIVWQNNDTGALLVWYMNGGERKSYNYLPTQEDLNYELKVVGDFDEDGIADLLFRDKQSGELLVWIMSENEIANSVKLSNYLDSSWELVSAKDFNSDGYLDLLYHNSSDGTNIVWFMQGLEKIGEASILGVKRNNWKVK